MYISLRGSAWQVAAGSATHLTPCPCYPPKWPDLAGGSNMCGCLQAKGWEKKTNKTPGKKLLKQQNARKQLSGGCLGGGEGRKRG